MRRLSISLELSRRSAAAAERVDSRSRPPPPPQWWRRAPIRSRTQSPDVVESRTQRVRGLGPLFSQRYPDTFRICAARSTPNTRAGCGHPQGEQQRQTNNNNLGLGWEGQRGHPPTPSVVGVFFVVFAVVLHASSSFPPSDQLSQTDSDPEETLRPATEKRNTGIIDADTRAGIRFLKSRPPCLALRVL